MWGIPTQLIFFEIPDTLFNLFKYAVPMRMSEALWKLYLVYHQRSTSQSFSLISPHHANIDTAQHLDSEGIFAEQMNEWMCWLDEYMKAPRERMFLESWHCCFLFQGLEQSLHIGHSFNICRLWLNQWISPWISHSLGGKTDAHQKLRIVEACYCSGVPAWPRERGVEGRHLGVTPEGVQGRSQWTQPDLGEFWALFQSQKRAQEGIKQVINQYGGHGAIL